MSAVEQLSRDVPTQLSVQSDWRDVTQLFAAAAKELKVGQLVHVQDFNLFDSMSALELMDPKMDAGLALHGAAPPSVAERVKRGEVPLTFVSARDVLATVDELFRVEAAWLNGQPLAQTLLTSVYMHKEGLSALLAQLVCTGESQDESAVSIDERFATRLDSLSSSAKDTLQLVVSALLALVVRTSNHVREIVVRADIYEEEDFSPGSSGALDAGVFDKWSLSALDLLVSRAMERMEALLSQERTTIATKASNKKASKKKGGKSKGVSNGDHLTSNDQSKLEGLDANVKISALLSEALLRRLQLRKQLHDLYLNLGFAEELSDLSAARAGFASTLELLKELSAESIEFDTECFSGKPFGFDKALSRILSSGSPPREVKATSMDEAIQIYQKLVSDMKFACSPGEWTRMEDVRIFLSDFSRRKPNIVARSLVLLLLYCEKKIYGRYGFMDWMTEEMVMNGVPSVLLSTQEGVQFSSRAIETVYESLKVYLHNRSRQRARIEYLLEEWSVLQLEATAVDERFMTEMQIPKVAYPRYFTAWSLEQVTLMMIQYVLLGFELDLYAPNEFSTIYWYLDYLCGSRLQNLNITWGFLERMNELMKDQPRRGAGAKKESNVDGAKARFQREISYMEMLRSMMRAYFQLFAALEREGLVSVAPPVYGSRVIRFQHRFAAFQSLHFPAPLTYDDYLKNSDFSKYGVDLIYKSAEECFKAARMHGDEARAIAEVSGATSVATSEEEVIEAVRCAEVQEVVHAAISNVINMTRREQEQVQQQKGRRAKATSTSPVPWTVEFDFSKHLHFPVVAFSSTEKR